MKKIFSALILACLASLSFSQENALWTRFPAISPDGTQVAFSYKGDLWVAPTTGGRAVPITLHEAYDQSPVWSPDGKSIAFSSDRYGNFDIFLVPATGGEAKRLTFHSASDNPSGFTPDGTRVLFSSSRLDAATNQQFPSGALPELYSVHVNGDRPQQELTVPAINAVYDRAGNNIFFHDQKGFEDPLRKHHTSSVARDIWKYEVSSEQFTQLTTYAGEDRSPIPSKDQQFIYFLSEESGSFNVYKMNADGSNRTALTQFDTHPVRSLSMSVDGVICFSYFGEIYTMTEGLQPVKVDVQCIADGRYNDEKIIDVRNASELAVSPNGKEVVFVFRGEVFVSSIKEGTTKRITNTPEQERSIDFSPDGRAILYTGERNGSWNLYQTKLVREEEKFFFNSTILEEEEILTSEAETFQPAYSPDGKEVAFLEERTSLRVINLESKEVRTIIPLGVNYSYSDGDQHYDWSPDGKWFLVNFLQNEQWIDQAGLVRSDGTGEIINLTHSGYGAFSPQWMMDGKMMLWFSSKDGQKNHASWGGEIDAYATFFTQEAYDQFKLSEEEFELTKDNDKEKDKEEGEEDDKKKKKGKDEEEEKKEIEPITIELDGLKYRTARLTIHSSDMSDAYVKKDGSKLYYLSRFEKGYDLWETNLRTRETKILAKLGKGGGAIVPDKEEKNLYILSNGGITQIDLAKGSPKPIGIKGEMVLNEDEERAYLFEHIWRQVLKKFYVTDLHGVDWQAYKEAYSRFLPHINNNYDFADLGSEMLGELNASHTGAFYRSSFPNADATAALGLFYDDEHSGDGLKIKEIMKRSPLIKGDLKIAVGNIIEKIDGVKITANMNYYPLLNRKAGQNVLLSMYNPSTKERWDEVVKPIGLRDEGQLRYERWVENCRKIVDEQSGGKIGYVHVRGMNDQSYRVVYDEALGKYHDKDALIVDTRFNGGGWLHDDLATFLSGKPYITFMPRGQNIGKEPHFKWHKPSAVVMCESNYSDAHMFPYTYKALGIGKLVGMPVPGTGTAVWWEGLQNGVVFGIPQVGMLDTEGDYLENKQLEPDVKVDNDYGVVSQGRDQQLEEAVKLLQQ